MVAILDLAKRNPQANSQKAKKLICNMGA